MYIYLPAICQEDDVSVAALAMLVAIASGDEDGSGDLKRGEIVGTAKVSAEFGMLEQVELGVVAYGGVEELFSNGDAGRCHGPARTEDFHGPAHDRLLGPVASYSQEGKIQ